MRQPHARSSVPSLIITVFVLGLMLALVVDLRERARRKAALPAARAAYQKARAARESAELSPGRVSHRRLTDDAAIQQLQLEIEHARADERARKAEYDRLRGSRTGLFW